MDTLEYQSWMDHGLWKIQLTQDASGTLGLAAPDNLRFTTAMTIEVRRSGQTNFSVWGKQCEIKDDGLHGIMESDGSPFVVQRDPDTGKLSCRFPVVPLPRRASGLSEAVARVGAGTLNARQAVTPTTPVTAPSTDPLLRQDASATWVTDPGNPIGGPKDPWGHGSHQSATT